MFSILFPVVGKLASGNIKSLMKKTRMQLIGTALLIGALFFASLFICLMFFFFLATIMAPVEAAAVMALIWLLISFVGIICLKISLDKQKKARQELISEEQRDLLTNTAMAAVPGVLAMGLKSYKKLGILTALAVGGIFAYNAFSGKNKNQDADDET